MMGWTLRKWEKNAYRILVGKRVEKWPLGRSIERRENNIKMDIREIGYEDGLVHVLIQES
jgi:hypothetical protein